MQINKSNGSECVKVQRGLKLRLCDVYMEPGQGAADFMGNELKKLNDKDLADFKQWFEDNGYPVA